MGLEINTVITLENQEKYKVLNDTMSQGKKYFLCKDINSNEMVIFEEELEGLDIYVKKVINKKLEEELMNLFKAER